MPGIKGLIRGVNNPALPERSIKATPRNRIGSMLRHCRVGDAPPPPLLTTVAGDYQSPEANLFD